jgi:hypothetical protein
MNTKYIGSKNIAVTSFSPDAASSPRAKLLFAGPDDNPGRVESTVFSACAGDA